MKSRPAIKSSRTSPRSEFLLAASALVLLSAAAAAFFWWRGWLLYYGDAEAHLDIARRIVDSRTPGYDQTGGVWLPLPHWLMLPLVRIDALWYSGIAGTVPSAAAFVAGGLFFFAAARRVFHSAAAGATALAVLALNPNLLYLQSIPMTESLSFACLAAVLYFTVRFRDTQGWGAVAGAGVAACAGALTRYDAWMLLPVVAVYFLIAARRRRVWVAAAFCLIAGAGPAFWLFHNWWLTLDPLDFYRGPWSPRAIQGAADYPGRNDWTVAAKYYRTAAQLCAGPCLVYLAIAGAVGALIKRAIWPMLLLAAPGVLYIWSMYNGTVPIFMPSLKPFSYYNTRYGLAVLPLLAFSAGGLAAIMPARFRGVGAVLIVLAAITPWVAHPRPSYWVTWEESRVNSESRRQWTTEAANYLRPRYKPGSGILTVCGAMGSIFREMRLPLRETFSCDNGLFFQAAVARPELWLQEEWVVTTGGGDAQTAVNRAARHGIRYSLEKTIITRDSPVIEIYRR
jgi:hypothetical protein